MSADAFNRLRDLGEENDDAGALMAGLRGRFQRIAGRHENGTAPRAVVAHQLFQTPPELAAQVVEALNPEPGKRWGEPSAGLGRILDEIAKHSPREVVAVELAAACAGELFKQDRPGVTIKQRDFLTCTPADLGLFDFVAMNPPFTMRADIRHIQHAIKFLAPGGRLSALCLDTPHREKALRPLASTWEKIPAGVFAKEGTGVACVLLTINT